MAIPSDGQITLNMIALELGFAQPYSLATMASSVGFPTPYTMSAFRGYSAGGGGGYELIYPMVILGDPCREGRLVDIFRGPDNYWYYSTDGGATMNLFTGEIVYFFQYEDRDTGMFLYELHSFSKELERVLGSDWSYCGMY